MDYQLEPYVDLIERMRMCKLSGYSKNRSNLKYLRHLTGI